MISQKIFNADDWGMSPAINEGILELVEKNLIGSVSLMPTTRFVKHGLDKLLKSDVKFNLHFNLTYADNDSFAARNNISGIRSLLGSIVRKKISAQELKVEFLTQMKLLRELGVKVNGIDGHHHVHLLPFVYRSICDEFSSAEIKEIRVMADIHHLSSYLLGKYFLNNVHDYAGNLIIKKYGYLMPKDLIDHKRFARFQKFDSVIVHPAKEMDFHQHKVKDSLQNARVNEYVTLMRLAQ